MRTSYAEKHKVSEWLRSNSERLLTEKPTWAALMRQVIAATEVDTGIETLKEIVTALGLKWQSVRPKNNGQFAERVARAGADIDALKERLATAENRIVQLNATITNFAKIVRDLQDALKLLNHRTTV